MNRASATDHSTRPATGDSLMSAGDNRRMFDRIAGRYDLINGILSLGQARRWRRKAVEELVPRAGGRYLDVGSGTGAIAIEICRQCAEATVVGIDAAPRMLEIAREKVTRAGLADAVSFQVGDGTALPFEDCSFTGAVSAFCIRNVTHRAKALSEMRRVLIPGGYAVILELTVPLNRMARTGYRFYSRCLVPPAGALIAGSRDAYQYLVDSILHFPHPAELAAQATAAGFAQVRCATLALGVVSVIVGQAV